MDLATETMQVTVLCIAASLPLLVAGAAGVGGSAALIAVFLAAAAGLYAARKRLGELPRILGHDLGAYGRTGWAAAAVAALTSLLALGASPAELQAVGGLLGLVGMFNYFLRPVYYALASVGRYLSRGAG